MGLSNPYMGFDIIGVNKVLPIFTTIPKDHWAINERLLPLIEQYRIEHSENHETNVKCNWRSDWMVQTDKRFSEFNEWILEACSFACQYHLNTQVTFSIANEWLMVYEKGDYAIPHEHFPYCLSVIYYVDCDENAAPVIFEDEVEINPEVGKLVIFPSELKHEVKQTEGKRVVVSMNLNQY
tara:strand:+ start:482 stop:1024 length:543 start_codon:yes stop_codon:yes gene_type:complete